MTRAFAPAVCLAVLLSTGVSTLLSGQPPATIVPRARPSTAQPAEPRGVLRADASLVVIPTWVTTAAGASVTSLTRENFHLTEDNVEQRIAYFIRDDAPLSIGLLFDTSGSMRNKTEKASESLAEFFKTANEQDEFFLVEFSEKARLTIPFTADAGEIYGRAARAKPFGRTSLLDGIGVALKQMKKARHSRKAIVIISDGGDNWSWHTARQIRNELLESDVQLYAMGIFDPLLSRSSPAENRNGPALLDELAEKTGGRHYPVGNLNDLPTISAKIGADLRNEYLLGYYPANSRDGKYHHVKVNLAIPDNTTPLRANYRRGYYATAE
jgi:Ca-activated chloride channel family protein